ncbi:NADPH:quinone oxidoreductase family protein [Indioceanicola profundi]|uniref:NADPH:quinone oxidoreductase family protein n=1 Tax=Indioceanicola profundi TaxID=2220096 RepID=UPI000E6AAB96|nr:NADPH:quinone oxidoreductase family protein [Indioceanicola profundi]
MRAVLCKSFGPPETLSLEEVLDLPLGPGQVRIDVKAAAMNFADTLIIEGKYQEKPPFPFIPGMECAGTVAEVGEGVRHLKPGMRVMALTRGAFATQTVADAAAVLPIPDQMGFAEAASFPVAYGTSHLALTDRANLKPGETLLVLGASGGVGLTAVEIGKAMGARVIAAASSAEKLDVAKAHGADDLVNYATEDLRARVKELAPKGVDVVFDPVGGDVFDAALRCMAWEGRMVVIGFAAGRIPQVPANLLLVKNIAVLGLFWGAYRQNNPQRLGQSLMELLGMWSKGQLKPHVSHSLPLERYAEAFELLSGRRSTGKVVLTME